MTGTIFQPLIGTLAFLRRGTGGLAVAVVLFLGVTGAPGAAADQSFGMKYRMGAGDVVNITVFEHKDLSGRFEVNGSGEVSMPLIGTVILGKLTVREAEKLIVSKLKPDYLINPRINVEIMNYRPFYILGEVKRPGGYEYKTGMTVVNAVALGGGYTYRARENNLYITKATDPERRKRKAGHDTAVMPGDVIEVPERFF